MRKWAELTEQEQAAIRHTVAQARIVHAKIYWPDIASSYDADFRSIERHMRNQFEPLRRKKRPPVPVFFEPDDTRSLTQRVLGDPLPGRSALDMERAAYG